MVVARTARICGLVLLPAFFYSLTGALFGVTRLVKAVVRAYGTGELRNLNAPFEERYLIIS
jgi:hypothetical protein